MEPKSPEQVPSPVEFTPTPPNSEEISTVPTVEREISSERGQELRQQTVPYAPAPPVQLPTPVPPQTPADDTQAVATSDDNPVSAADEDLIEKEWVDKAKKIVQDTKDDPHAREQQVGKLQVDYLKKRYGKELGNQT